MNREFVLQYANLQTFSSNHEVSPWGKFARNIQRSIRSWRSYRFNIIMMDWGGHRNESIAVLHVVLDYRVSNVWCWRRLLNLQPRTVITHQTAEVRWSSVRKVCVSYWRRLRLISTYDLWSRVQENRSEPRKVIEFETRMMINQREFARIAWHDFRELGPWSSQKEAQ